MLDPIDQLQAIDSLKVNFNIEDLENLVKRARKSKTQQSLAIIVSRRYNDAEGFAKIEPLLV